MAIQDSHLIPATASIREAFAKLNLLSGGNMTLFVVNNLSEKVLVGSLTDGDLRRAIISEATLDIPVDRICHHDCIRISGSVGRYDTIVNARNRGIYLLPVVDPADGHILDLLDLKNLKAELPLDAVLMAGGKGERLRPLTLDTPKPLLSVGDKAIIDYNIDELFANGIDHIFVTVNYLKESIIAHFADPRFDNRVKCVAEPKRLGTMGSLALVEGLKEDNLIVMNSDLLTSLNFEKMYLQHSSSGAALTMGVIPYSVSIPFAIISTEGRKIKGLTEKPTYNYFANAGVYMMRRDIVDRIPKGEYLDAPDLIDLLISDGELVEYFPIEGIWIDIGSPDDYRYANELMKLKGLSH
ncbi:MAG: NTP transferase domain-containing protein [Muribaculaceae bacterium]|nr:NTP transferase domain-containing protein [Muribaculaceae bacterium]